MSDGRKAAISVVVMLCTQGYCPLQMGLGGYKPAGGISYRITKRHTSSESR
jgi:hypothetical protein